MKCKVCGAESGKYAFCRTCNARKTAGEIIKCVKCGEWHAVTASCKASSVATDDGGFLYERKVSLISKSEQKYYEVIKSSVPEGYCVFPQINLSSFIDRIDDARYRNELFRNVDFLITDSNFGPMVVIEINDQTHMNYDRKERDEKVRKICEEAGIPIIKFWTSYGVNPEYIKSKIDETLASLPIQRIKHFVQSQQNQPAVNTQPVEVYPSSGKKEKGCYVATCVYGSYDCPQVWVLRRYRDYVLSSSGFGRAFIKAYYAISPTVVKMFGQKSWFTTITKGVLDKIVEKLQKRGYLSTPYNDL